MGTLIKVVARAEVVEAKIVEYIKMAMELAQETRKEKGCISYDLYRNRESRNILTFIEEWESMDCLEKHFETSHFKKYVPLLKEMRLSSQLDIYEPV